MAGKTLPPEPEVRLMRKDDLDAVIEIDANVFGQRRPEYYERKITLALEGTHQVVTSMVIELERKVVGFIIGEVYLGEFGVSETSATIDTIGIDPTLHKHGLGTTLFKEYTAHLKQIGIQFISTRVNWNDWGLLGFFEKVGFMPSKAVHLECKLS